MSLLINLNPFFSPEDSSSGAGDTLAPLTSNDILKSLEDDSDDEEDTKLPSTEDDEDDVDEVKPKKSVKKDSSKEDDDSDSGEDDTETEEDDELKALEEDLEEPDEEKLELVTPVRRSEILKKYPTLFKDFPYLQTAYYREQQFTELFPTVDKAKDAANDVETLNRFEQDLREGDLSNILGNTFQADKNSFHKLVDNFLPTLAKVDQSAYHHVIGNVTKQLIGELYKEGEKTGNEVFKNVALLVNQFMFSTSEYEPPSKLSRETAKNPEAEELKKEKEQFNSQRFQVARDDLLTKIDNNLKSTIDQNIDPKGVMSEFVKKHASKEALDKLEGLIRKDTRFRGILKQYWDKAQKSNYSPESMKQIRTAYLSRAKALLPAVLKSARIEALKGSGGRKPSSESSEEVKTRKGPIPNSGKSTASSNSGNRSGSSAKPIPPGMSPRDYIMAD